MARGLELVSAPTVVVHDAARPFLTTSLVKRVLEALERFDGVVAAEPVEETLKRVADDRVVDTVDRAHVWRAQTPQAFLTEVLRASHARAARDGLAATDDAQLVERAGGRVGIVRGDRRNIKLTYEEDFKLAEAIAREWP